MATSLFFMATDQNPAAKPQAVLPRNTHVATGEIRSEPLKSRGRKPGSKAAKNQKKVKKRGMSMAKLELEIERLKEQEEKKMVDTSMANPNTRFSLPDPVSVGSFPMLQGLPNYGGPMICPVVGSSGSGPLGPKINGGFSRFSGFCCGTGSGQILIDPAPVYSPETWGFVETSKEFSSMPNPHVSNCSDRCGACFKKKRYDGDAIRSNGGGICKYGMISPLNGYDPPVFVQERNSSFVYDHRNGYIARTAAPPGSLNCSNQCFNEVTNHTGSMEMLGSNMIGNPRNGGPVHIIKEYEFFPGKFENFSGKYENFPGKYGKSTYTKEMEASVVSVSDRSTNTSAIDLSLKL